MPEIKKIDKKSSTFAALLRLAKQFKYIGLVLVLSTFILGGYKNAKYIMHARVSFFEHINRFVDKFFFFNDRIFFILQDGYDQVQELQIENKRLKYELLENQIVKSENQQLRQLLNFVSDKPKTLKASAILNVYLSDYEHSISISGGKDIYNLGDIVVHENGLVGQIIEQSSNYSKVKLLTDPNFRVTAIAQESGVRCIVSGNGSKTLELKLLEYDVELNVGEILTTSSNGVGFPKGVYIGKLIAQGQTSAILSDLSINRLEYVFVLSSK